MAFVKEQRALSGYRGRVRIQNTAGGAVDADLLATKWSLTYKTELQDASTFEEVTGGATGANTPISRYVASMTDMEISIDAYYDVNNGWIATLRPGTELSAILYINKPQSAAAGNIAKNSAGANVPDESPTRSVAITFLVENCTYDVEVRGVVKYSITGKVSGGTALSFT